jgi:drug/metabolite transporter (DMT)-like permease
MGIVAAIMTFLIEVNQFFGIFMISKTFLTFPLKIPSEETFYIIIGHAIGSILGGILITVGYQKGETSFVSVFEYSFLLFATLWAYMFFAEFISSIVLFGMILIVISGFLISLSEKKNNFS